VAAIGAHSSSATIQKTSGASGSTSTSLSIERRYENDYGRRNARQPLRSRVLRDDVARKAVADRVMSDDNIRNLLDDIKSLLANVATRADYEREFTRQLWILALFGTLVCIGVLCWIG
jgi:hypothetical protein